MIDPDLIFSIGILVAGVLGVLGFMMWRGRQAWKSSQRLQAMLDEHGVQPNADLRDKGGEVALLWVEPESLFIYANCVTGTNRRIDADDVSRAERSGERVR